MHVKMPMNRFSHHYTHNIPLKEEFNEIYKNMGICDGLCYQKYQFKWSVSKNNNLIFEVEFTIETQYYYAGGFELLKISNINFESFTDKKTLIDKAIRDIIGSDKDIRDFYDILSIEEKSKNKKKLYENFEKNALNGRFLCHTFIELYKQIMKQI